MTDPTEPMLRFFAFAHLRDDLQAVSRPFGELADRIVETLPRNPERTVALRKLLEAKDCAVRALLYQSSDLKLTVTSWGVVALDKREMKKLMRAAGNDIRSQTSRLINKSSGSGRLYRGMGGGKYRGGYRPGLGYRASAPGEPPVRVTNTLRGSLKTYAYPSGEGFAVRERVFYALFLEVGAHGGGPGSKRSRRATRGHGIRELAPRPSLDVVMAKAAPVLSARVERAMTQGLTWKQAK